MSASSARTGFLVRDSTTPPGLALISTEALDRASPNNWLDDNLWTKKAYLEWRSPLLVNSNWWLAVHDDDLIPAHANKAQPGITPWQVRRGAWLVHRVLCFKDRLDR